MIFSNTKYYNLMNIKFFSLCFFVFISQFSFSQMIEKDTLTTKKHYSLTSLYQNGYVFQTNEFVRGRNAENDTINAFETFSIRYTKQTSGKKLWQQLYNYPEYGIGIWLGNFYNPEEIGLPIALYGYFSAPFYRWEKISIDYELGFGMTFNWKSYSPANIYNIAISSKMTSYIDFGIKVEYCFTNKFCLDLGFSVSHFSNGRLKEPNYGLNTIAPKIGLKYNFNKDIQIFNKQIVRKYSKRNEFCFYSFIGSKNILYDSLNISASEKFEGESYLVTGFSFVYNRQMSYKSKIGLGFDISYDGSVNAQIAVENGELEISSGKFANSLQISVFPSYELVINKVSLILQPGIYIYRHKFRIHSPVFYQRIGLKYNFYNNLFIGLNLRAYKYHISDFIEWNFGIKI